MKMKVLEGAVVEEKLKLNLSNRYFTILEKVSLLHYMLYHDVFYWYRVNKKCIESSHRQSIKI